MCNETAEKYLDVGSPEPIEVLDPEKRLAALDRVGRRGGAEVERVRYVTDRRRDGPGRAPVVRERLLGRDQPQPVPAAMAALDPACQEQRSTERAMVARRFETAIAVAVMSSRSSPVSESSATRTYARSIRARKSTRRSPRRWRRRQRAAALHTPPRGHPRSAQPSRARSVTRSRAPEATAGSRWRAEANRSPRVRLPAWQHERRPHQAAAPRPRRDARSADPTRRAPCASDTPARGGSRRTRRAPQALGRLRSSRSA